MNTMQVFYNRLFAPTEAPNAYRQGLAELTRVQPAQMLAFKSNLDWVPW